MRGRVWIDARRAASDIAPDATVLDSRFAQMASTTQNDCTVSMNGRPKRC